MRRIIMWTGVIIMFSMLTVGAGAQFSSFEPPPWVAEMPDCEPMAWEDGQFVTYRMHVAVEGEDVAADMRIAIVGSERIGGEDYYWLELDIWNVSGIPEDLGLEDGDFDSFYLQLLMKEYDISLAEEDPEAFLKDLTSMEFLKRVIFQLNDENPMELDMSFLMMMGPMLEMGMEDGMMEFESEYGDEVEDMWDGFDWEFGRRNVTTPAGNFIDALHFWFSFEQEEANGEFDIYIHEDVPLSCLVKIAGNVEAVEEDGSVELVIELIKKGNNADGWITGEPELFNPMAGMMGGGFG